MLTINVKMCKISHRLNRNLQVIIPVTSWTIFSCVRIAKSRFEWKLKNFYPLADITSFLNGFKDLSVPECASVYSIRN